MSKQANQLDELTASMKPKDSKADDVSAALHREKLMSEQSLCLGIFVAAVFERSTAFRSIYEA